MDLKVTVEQEGEKTIHEGNRFLGILLDDDDIVNCLVCEMSPLDAFFYTQFIGQHVMNCSTQSGREQGITKRELLEQVLKAQLELSRQEELGFFIPYDYIEDSKEGKELLKDLIKSLFTKQKAIEELIENLIEE